MSHQWADDAADADADGSPDAFEYVDPAADTWASLDHRPAYVDVPTTQYRPVMPYRSSMLAPMNVAGALKKCRKRPGPYLSQPAHSSEAQSNRARAAWVRDSWDAGPDPAYALPASTRRRAVWCAP